MSVDGPAPDEIEFSLFGPGIGECATVHIGDGKWIIVDSCANPQTKEPAVLEYFELLRVEPEQAIKLVVATHWHEDHVAGIAKILRRATNANFVCSDALRCDEFLPSLRPDFL